MAARVLLENLKTGEFLAKTTCLVGGVLAMWLGQELIEDNKVSRIVGDLSLLTGGGVWLFGVGSLMYDTLRDQ